ncbi:MAG: LysM peptidoglycan-binding domain-containing protein [Pseudomonadota bacterium]
MSPMLSAAAVLVLVSCATLPGPAAAVPAPAAAATAEEGSEPARESGEGSLWDSIEQALDGQPPPQEIVEASGELAAERSAEQDFLEVGSGSHLEQALAWYLDPLATLTQDPLFLDRLDPAEFDLPVVITDEVKLWMRYFLGSGRKYYTHYLARSTRFRPMIEAGLDARGMPRDLFYLAMIESGFSPQAISKAGAVGLWQFMAPTARAYHLRVEWWVDERRDPARATDAALDHLQDLHGMFGDWYMAAAAYNAGAGRVRTAARRAGSDDYWVVAQPGNLARETCSYVPKMLAAAIIGHHPERYGFTGVDYQPALAAERAAAPGSTSLSSLASCAGVAEPAFQELNPALRRWALPPEPASYEVNIPAGKAEAFSACVERIPPSERVAFTRHVVKKGESLGSIAKRYGVSTTAIVKMNKIANPNRIYVGTELVIPTPGAPIPSSTEDRDTPASPAPSARAPAGQPVWHNVKRGETLDAIAAHYHVSVADLIAWNGIAQPDRIQAGQRLRVGSADPARDEPRHYKVAPGDTLSGIAARFSVSVADLQRWNHIRDSSQIKVGQDLVVYAATSDWVDYRVESGDTLDGIARAHGCTVADLKAWNHLTNNTIYAGQHLTIRR